MDFTYDENDVFETFNPEVLKVLLKDFTIEELIEHLDEIDEELDYYLP